MKLMKRATALLLSFLILTNGPISAFATEGVSDNDVVVETTTEIVEVCEECGGSDAHTDTCSLNTINLMNQNDTVVCTVCGAENCEATHVYCDTCEKYDCGLTHTTCDKCGTVDCQSTHEAWCDTCKKDSCGVDHTTPADNNGETVNGSDVGCNECKQTEGHLDTCSQYVAPVAKCEHCGIELTEGAVHLDTCLTHCTCEPVEGVHQEDCKLYVAPVTKCEHCGIELTEGAVHLDTCLTHCTCEPVEGVHQEGCKLYIAPVEDVADNNPQIGDKIWIKHDSYVYKNQSTEKGHKLLLNYEVEIVNIITDENGNAVWYEFAFTTTGIGEWFIREYKYVQVENTSVEEPEPADENACNCGETAPENIADHADSCPRKQYIKTLFEGKTAEEIYTQWESYDEATQTDLLNMLQKWDNAKYEELNKLIEEGFNNEQKAVVGDTDIVVAGIPENVSLAVSSVSENDYHSALAEYVGSDSELLFVYDITLTNPDGSEWQPANGQSATITLDFNDMGFADGNVLSVLHEHDGELESLGEYAIEEGKLTFTTDGFSKFYFYITYTFGEKSFTMSGGSTVYLSEILRELSISYGIGDVANVQFTNPDVLEVTKVGSDWKLESLAPFGSEEILTILFNDGENIEIVVKDPVIFNYAVGSDITNVNKLATKSRTFDDCNNGDNTPLNNTYTTSSNSITNAELINAAGTAASVDIIIYAEPGMAIGFEAGTTWGTANSEIGFARPKADNDDYIWYWSWIRQSSIDSNYSNYVFVKEGTAGQQATFKIQAVSENTNVTVNVTLCSVADSSPTLLQGNLPSGYSIKNVPVTLYNYDGGAFNKYYESQDSSTNYFAFSGTVRGVNSREDVSPGWGTSGVQANGGGGVALMGIVKDTLVDGLPVMSQGQKVDVFSTNNASGKSVYENVNFQFVYNESTGYYNYNSALNHAQYNSATNTIELYKQSLGPSDTPNGASYGNAGFYPFEDINKAYTNTGYTAISESEWLSKLENEQFLLTPSQYSSDIALTSASNSTVDLHYGLQVKSDFYMPTGKQLNGQDMVYEFCGDDDLWVFIDNKLVLDIGGGHTYVHGSFNLTTGEVWVEKYTKLAAADGGSYSTREQGTDLRYTDSFLTGLKDDQMHTIQIFYLERHAGVSNCHMRFNLPLVPSDAVNVSKNLVNQDGEELSVTPDVDYTFTLYTAEGDASGKDDVVNATSFSVKANAPYTVTGANAPTGTLYTGSDGKFTLKDGWIASFQGIPRFAEVKVIETSPNDGYVYKQSMVSVNKAEATSYKYGDYTETKVMQLNSSINFDFTNYMQTQPLVIEKQVVNGTKGLIDQNQKFTFTLDFTKNILETGEGAIKADNSVTLTDGGTFQLGHNESIRIPRVPVNMTFTLKEANPDPANGSFDAPKFESTICTTTDTPNAFDTNYTWTMGNNGENKVVVTNQQRFNLTISKTGIQNVDHDNDEQQSTIYTIVGKIGDNVLMEMDVVICGNDSVTVCKLPVGSYTVEENTDWSWRYDPVGGATKNVAIPENANAEVAYSNTRTNQYWLSGDCYVENWWDNGTIKKRNGSDEVIE